MFYRKRCDQAVSVNCQTLSHVLIQHSVCLHEAYHLRFPYLNGMSHFHYNSIVFSGICNWASIVVKQLISGKFHIQVAVKIIWEENDSWPLISTTDPCHIFDFNEFGFERRKVIETDHILKVVSSWQDVLQNIKYDITVGIWITNICIREKSE